MDEPDRRELQEAFRDTKLDSTTALRAVMAVLNELARGRLLDPAALDRIEAFMVNDLPASGASEEAQRVLRRSIEEHFGDLRKTFPRETPSSW